MIREDRVGQYVVDGAGSDHELRSATRPVRVKVTIMCECKTIPHVRCIMGDGDDFKGLCTVHRSPVEAVRLCLKDLAGIDPSGLSTSVGSF